MSSKRIPFAGVRKAITQRLSPGFHQALPVALMMEFRADRLLEYRAQKGRPSITACAVKAAALALKKHPEINVTFEGEELVYHEEVNIAVGVDTPKGLRAPVIKDADKKTLEELTRIIDEFAEKGRRGEITLADQEGHSFTVTNLGMAGVTYFTPIINPPDCAILGVGTIVVKPILSGDKVVMGNVGYLTLVFDHRVIDGMPASRFLNEIKALLENPAELE
jgi:pyruvate dehydrogenase E2 component (dihydrolipoamide acetyltransferase)